jgi:hypothetical protein
MKVDVTKMLEEDALEFEVYGKTYRVFDVPLSMFLEMEKDKDRETEGSFQVLVKRLAFMLNISEKEVIESIGINAAKIINIKVMDWLNKKVEGEIESIPLSGKEQ